MQINVRLYATFRRFLPDTPIGHAVAIELPAGSTVGDALDYLGVPRAETKICFLNGLQRELDFPLTEGDELGAFPPVGGG